MGNDRSGEVIPGELHKAAAMEKGMAANELQTAEREGDVIQGLRSGLIFSVAIWAMLLTVGALVLK
jgi:hypothetical protein